jgi:hypothetical protein
LFIVSEESTKGEDTKDEKSIEEDKSDEIQDDTPDNNSESEKEDILDESSDSDDSNDFKADINMPLSDQFPMRNEFNFNNLIISSKFDAGNLRKWIDISGSDPCNNLDSEQILKSNKNK